MHERLEEVPEGRQAKNQKSNRTSRLHMQYYMTTQRESEIFKVLNWLFKTVLLVGQGATTQIEWMGPETKMKTQKWATCKTNNMNQCIILLLLYSTSIQVVCIDSFQSK